MPEPEWWTGLKKRKEPLPGFGAGEPQWIKDFWEWFMGRNQQQPTAPTAPQHFPGAPGQTYTTGGITGQPTLTPQEQQAQDMMRIEQETAQIQLELLKQRLYGTGAGGQITGGGI